MSIITVEGLKKNYHKLIAVDSISFSVPEGCIFGMLGPNGAGKTTTIECIIGLKERDAGTVSVLGFDPKKDGRKLCRLIGVQLQETTYQDKIKVSELLNLFAAMYSRPLDYLPLLERFDLADKRNKYISELSGGQRQKIAIILALIPNPQLIFLDELTTGLDPQTRRNMWQVVRELKAEGRTIFMTTHYMEEAEALCDILCIIDNGRIAAHGDLDTILNAAGLDSVITFEGEPQLKSIIQNELPNIEKVEFRNGLIHVYTKCEETGTNLILLLHENHLAYKNFNMNRPSLEGAFLKLTGKAWGEQA